MYCIYKKSDLFFLSEIKYIFTKKNIIESKIANHLNVIFVHIVLNMIIKNWKMIKYQKQVVVDV